MRKGRAHKALKYKASLSLPATHLPSRPDTFQLGNKLQWQRELNAA